MFKITVPIHECSIVKSVNKDTGEESTKRRIVGIASGTELDRDEEEFALSALKAMQQAIEEGITLPDGTHSLVPLQSDHRASWLTDLGFLTKAWIEEGDEEHNLWIEAELNDSPSADYFYKLLTEKNEEKGRPTRLGMSIGGLVTKAHKKVNQATQKAHLVFDHILLKEVSIVSQPAYPTQYLQALTKSYQEDKDMEEENVQDIVAEGEQAAAKNDASEKNEAVAPESTPNITEPATEKEVEEAGSEGGEGVAKAVSPEDFETLKGEVIAVNKAVTDIAGILEQLRASYAHFSVSFEADRNADGNVDTEKSITEPETVDTEAAVQKSVNDAFVLYTEKALTPLINMINDLQAQVAELANQPVDKSLSVTTYDSTPKSPKEIYERRKAMAAVGTGQFDSIAESVKAALEGR